MRFDETPRADHRERDKQAEISVDYRMCYEAMAQGRPELREHLAAKYGRELRTIGQLNELAQELFSKMDADSRAYDLYDAERKLQDALEGQEDGPDHS